MPSDKRYPRVSAQTNYHEILSETFARFQFLNSSFRILYGAFLLQFSFVLPLTVAISNDERRYTTFLEGYLVFLNCTAIPALIALHFVLWRINKVSVHRWLYQKMLSALRARRRKASAARSRRTSDSASLRQKVAVDTSRTEANQQADAKSNAAAAQPTEVEIEGAFLISTPTSDSGLKDEQTVLSDCDTKQDEAAHESSNASADPGCEAVAEAEAGLPPNGKTQQQFESNNGANGKSSSVAFHVDATNESGADIRLRINDTKRNTEEPHVESHEDHLAEPVTGPDIMMRIGAFGFGLAGMALNILRISDRWTNPTYHQYCRTSMSMWMFVFHILFYLVQTYFLFKHQGHRFPRNNRFVRFLLLHLIVANIALWINAVVVEVTEDLHEKTYEYLGADRTQQNESYLHLMFQLKEGKITVDHALDHESIKTRKQFMLYYCHSQNIISASAATYLFPLLVEYFIISASILCKIYLSSYTWIKRVGRADSFKHRSVKKSARSSSQTSRLLARRSEFDDIEVIDDDFQEDDACCSCEKSLTGLIGGSILLLISVGSVVAFLVVLARKRVDEDLVETLEATKEDSVGEKEFSEAFTEEANITTYNSSLSHSTGLSNEEKAEQAEANVLTSTFVALMIYQAAELVLVVPPLVACVLAFFKFRAHFIFRRPHRSERIDAQQLFIGYIGVLIYNTFIVIASFERITEVYTFQVIIWALKTFLSMVQSTLQIGFILRGFRSMLPPGNMQLFERKPGRSVITFLILANLALWLTNTFQMKYVDQVPDLYHTEANITPWSIITHLLIPFTIFFRFHSTISLLHIWHVDYEEFSDAEGSTSEVHSKNAKQELKDQ